MFSARLRVAPSRSRHLTTTKPRQHCRSRQEKTQPIRIGFLSVGAGERSRTLDLRITNALLYQLSYTGVGADSN